MADFDLDEDAAGPACIAPPDWPDAMTQAALDAGLVVETAAGADAAEACRRAAKRLAQWAEAPGLSQPLEKLLLSGRAALDPPLLRATLSSGAELALSASLIHWPSEPRDELEAVARAQTLLSDGARIGIAGTPSAAALDALDAAARMADPSGRDGAAILVRPTGDNAAQALADETARSRASAAFNAGARALDAALADLAIEAVRNGLELSRDGVQRKAAAARLAGAPDADIVAALGGAVARGAYAAALDAGIEPSRRRIQVAAGEAGEGALSAFRGAADPTGAIAADDEQGAIGAGLALHRFSADGAFDIAAFENAVRLITRALDAAHGRTGGAGAPS